jgi:hypothetical protein
VPPAKSSGSRSGSSSSSSGASKKTASKRASGSRSTSAKRTTPRSSSSGTTSRSRSTKSASARSTGSAGAASAKSSTAADPRLEAVAQRVRKLNERIIEASKDAGEVTLSSYEKALKAIASTIERGPGKSDVEWISALATTQAKFLRDVTNAWASAARGMLK